MKVSYDKEVDSAFIRFSSKRPSGGIEVAKGVILHLTEEDELVAVEILDVTKHFPPHSLLKLEEE